MMNNVEIALTELIKKALFGLPANFPENTDFKDLLNEAKEQTVVALVNKALPEPNAEWGSLADQSKAFFMRALYEQSNAVSLLKEKKIPFVIIKGASSAIYYPTPANRTMGDVDLLVAKEYFDSAYRLLKENGYEFMHDNGNEREYSFKKGGVVFELHKKYSDEGYDIENVLNEGISHAQDISLYGNNFPCLPYAINGLLILDHIRHHIYGGLGLRQLIDFICFVNYEKDEAKFIKEVLPILDDSKLGKLARVITKIGKKYFGLPVCAKWCETAEDDLCEKLLESVFASGNFGRKNPYVYKPARSLSMSIRKYGFFRTLQKAGMENCDAFKKYKILRPFAWLYQFFRYAIRGVKAFFGKEKIAADISEGKARAEFFKRLGIE